MIVNRDQLEHDEEEHHHKATISEIMRAMCPPCAAPLNTYMTQEVAAIRNQGLPTPEASRPETLAPL